MNATVLSCAPTQVNVALMMDAVDIIVHGLRSLLIQNPDVFRRTFRRGQVFNNETRGIQCDRTPLVPWVHGHTIRSHLLNVNFTGITGPVTFDPVTGQRSRYRLDVMALRFDAELRKVIITRLILSVNDILIVSGHCSTGCLSAEGRPQDTQTRYFASVTFTLI